MKDTRAGGGGAIACKWLKMNELETRVVRFHAEPGFFAGEKSPLLIRESTGDAGYLSDAGFLIGHYGAGYIRIHSNNDGL